MKIRLQNCLVVFCTFLLIETALANDPYADDRSKFLEARQALHAGQLDQFQRLEADLHDYPLYPYLQYDQLSTTLGKTRDADMQAFLDTYADSPLAERLRRSWLSYLAKQHQWPRFIAFYDADQASVELQCHYLHATRREPASAEWLDAATKLWMVGSSRPDTCDPVFKVLSASTRMTQELVWQRINLAMQENAPSLASYLARMLPANQRKWVDTWREAHERPASAQNLSVLKQDNEHSRDILAHAVGRLGRSDAAAAQSWWSDIQKRYDFSAEQRAKIPRQIGLYAAYQRLPEAHVLLAALPEDTRDNTTRGWQARSALLQRDWPAIAAAIDAMPAEESQDGEWRYWRAQAESEQGHADVALPMFSALAKERSYHGFLAADILQQDYSMQDQPLVVSDTQLTQLQEKYPGLLRAGELLRANLVTDARREWGYALRDMPEQDLQSASVLAHRWGWHDRAIITAGKSGYQDDLNMRFPLLYSNEITKIATQLNMDPSWIMGIMRQESAFMVDARSSAGALGLMQLMPATGAEVARRLKLAKPSSLALLQADTNIRLGSNYLKQAFDSLGNQVLATAAYNAGPYRVRSWLPDSPMSTPLWVDTIPFSETRGYVRGVLAFATVYESRLQRPITPLNKRMPAMIKPQDN